MAARVSTYRTNDITQFFSFDGRVRRSTFWINTLVLWAISWIMSLAFVDTYLSPYTWEVETHISNKFFYYLIAFVIAGRQLSISVRRWHDIDKSGSWAALGAFPVLVSLFPTLASPASEFGSFILVIVALVTLHALGMQGYVPGDEGSNDYGSPPVEGQIL